MTEQEKLMYDFLARVSKTNAPIVFKGGLITKLILSENGFTDVQRTTKDVDANWIGSPPSMQEMVHTISKGGLNGKRVLNVKRRNTAIYENY